MTPFNSNTLFSLEKNLVTQITYIKRIRAGRRPQELLTLLLLSLLTLPEGLTCQALLELFVFGERVMRDIPRVFGLVKSEYLIDYFYMKFLQIKLGESILIPIVFSRILIRIIIILIRCILVHSRDTIFFPFV